MNHVKSRKLVEIGYFFGRIYLYGISRRMFIPVANREKNSNIKTVCLLEQTNKKFEKEYYTERAINKTYFR